MTSVTKRWSLPARMRSTPEYTHVHPPWTKKGRASFNDCNYTESLTRFVVNCMNSSGSVLDTCILDMFHATLPRRNVDVHSNVSYSSTERSLLLSYHINDDKNIPLLFITWLPDSMRHQSTCDKLIAEDMSSDEETCVFRYCVSKQANYVESSSDFENITSLQHKIMTSASKNISWNASFDTASSHRSTRSSHQSLRKLGEHVVSSSVSPCCVHAVCDVLCCPDRLSPKRDSVWRGSPPINNPD